jgi:tetratricopeptide (TPR) repeat protein
VQTWFQKTAGAAIVVCVLSAPASAQSVIDACIGKDAALAVRACTMILEHPQVPQKMKSPIFTTRGVQFFALGEIPKAKADFEAAIAADPEHEEIHTAYNELGLAKLKLGDAQGAIAAFNEGVRRNPKSANLFYNRAIVLIETKDLKAAENDLKEAIKLGVKPGETTFVDTGSLEQAPDARVQANYHNLLAKVYVAQGRAAEAVAAQDEAVKRYPKYAYVYQNRAFTHLSNNNLALAVADLDRANTLEPNNARAVGLRGYIRYQQGDFKSSGEDFSKAIAINPNDAFFPREFSPMWAYLMAARSGAPNASLALAAQTAQLPAKWPMPVIQLLLGKTSLDSVLAEAKTAEQKCEANFYIGQWHLTKGNTAAARANLTAAVNECPATETERDAAAIELKRLGN